MLWWLLLKYCLQRQGISGFSRTRVKSPSHAYPKIWTNSFFLSVNVSKTTGCVSNSVDPNQILHILRVILVLSVHQKQPFHCGKMLSVMFVCWAYGHPLVIASVIYGSFNLYSTMGKISKWQIDDIFKPIFAYRQTVWTQIRLLKEQSDLGPHCLQKWLLKSQADDNRCALRVKNTCCRPNKAIILRL